MSQAPGQAIPLSSFNALTPPGGPKVLPINVDFTGGKVAVGIDLGQQQTQNKIPYIQSVFIDNSGNASPVTLTGSLLGQSIICPAKTQLWTPILMPNPPQLTCYSAGGVVVPMFFCNVPLPFGAVNVAGVQSVTDANLEALITNIGAAGNGLATYVINPTSSPVNVNVVSGGASSTTTTGVNQFDVTAGNTFGFNLSSSERIAGFDVTLSPNAYNGVGEWNIFSGVVNGFNTWIYHKFWVPAAAPGTPNPNALQTVSHMFVNPLASTGGAAIYGYWHGTALTAGTFSCSLYITP